MKSSPLLYPKITLADVKSQRLFSLPLAPLGGKGNKKAPLRDLIRLLIFRGGLTYELKQTADGVWQAHLKRRGGRKVTVTKHSGGSLMDAEADFLHLFVSSATAAKRAAIFNVSPK